MIVADTNIWARALLGDDPAQSPRARQALAGARGREGVFVPLVVLAELSWVLEDNEAMNRILRRLTPEPYRRYRVYERAL